MSKKKTTTAETRLEEVESVLTRTEKYIEDNQKSLTIIVVAIMVIVGVYLGYNRFYVSPKEKEAQSQMFVAEQYFEKDSFQFALNGDGNYLGFIDIIDEYGVTKSANLAYYYAGISSLRLGKYEEAIDYLRQFDSDDQLISSIALGAIGDAYVELKDLDEAASFFQKAAVNNKNKLTSPLYMKKAGLAFEESGNLKKALKIYTKIKEEYPKTQEGNEAEKYITRIEAKLGK